MQRGSRIERVKRYRNIARFPREAALTPPSGGGCWIAARIGEAAWALAGCDARIVLWLADAAVESAAVAFAVRRRAAAAGYGQRGDDKGKKPHQAEANAGLKIRAVENGTNCSAGDGSPPVQRTSWVRYGAGGGEDGWTVQAR
jgi:hypothetical protein